MSPLFVTCELLMMTCWKGIFHAIKLYVCQLIERKGRGEARFRFLDFIILFVLFYEPIICHYVNPSYAHSASFHSLSLFFTFSSWSFWMSPLVTRVSKMWYLPVNDGVWVWLNSALGGEIKTVGWWVKVQSFSKAQGYRNRGLCSKHSDSS